MTIAVLGAVLAVVAAADGGVDDRLLVALAVAGVVIGFVVLALAVGPRRPGDPDDGALR
jgi:hypothetical protein